MKNKNYTDHKDPVEFPELLRSIKWSMSYSKKQKFLIAILCQETRCQDSSQIKRRGKKMLSGLVLILFKERKLKC